MIHYKPYHYHLIFASVFFLCFAGACYMASVDTSTTAVILSTLMAGIAGASAGYHFSLYRKEKRSCRSVERILEYAQKEREE